ncbi:MAG: hypothetical protein KDB27_26420 [Planctomycetales bacterium]|nr:hypothetical protein [Planctomycetales bacterium]
MSKLPPIEAMHIAFENRDSQFDGVFYVGVKTTGVYCRPTCPARRPKRDNIEFFASA